MTLYHPTLFHGSMSREGGYPERESPSCFIVVRGKRNVDVKRWSDSRSTVDAHLAHHFFDDVVAMGNPGSVPFPTYSPAKNGSNTLGKFASTEASQSEETTTPASRGGKFTV